MPHRVLDWWRRRKATAELFASMAARPTSVLSPAIAAELSKLLEKRPSGHDVPCILSGLSTLPAQSIARASREITHALRLGWWRRNSGLASYYFRKPLSEAEFLRVEPGYAWIFLFHDSGYVRQAALKAIAKPPLSPFFFAALAWRLNDWVYEVRQAAVDCAGRVLPETDPAVSAEAALHLLGRRFEWQRWGDERQALDPIFGRADVIGRLADLLCKRATGPLASALSYALRYPEMDDHLPRLVADAVQPAVRAIAYRCLVFRKATWITGVEWTWVDKIYGYRRRTPVFASRQIRAAKPVEALIAEGVHDRAAAIRWIAAGALLQMRARVPNAEALIASLAGDRSPAIRARAEFMMRNPA